MTVRKEESALRATLRSVWREVFSDHAFLVGAGLAYSAVFGMLPALALAAVLWDRLGGLDALQAALDASNPLLPRQMAQVLKEFVTSVPQGLGGGLALLLNAVLVVWTALRAASGLLTALHIVFDVEETRPMLVRLGVALCIGLGGICMLFVAIAVLASGPLLQAVAPDGGTELIWLRWPILVAFFGGSLLLLFRFGPNRRDGQLRSSLVGAAVAAVLWAGASAAVSAYLAHAGSYGKLYGSLGGVAVVLLWFYLGSVSVLIGAETDGVLLDRHNRRHAGGRVRSSTLST